MPGGGPKTVVFGPPPGVPASSFHLCVRTISVTRSSASGDSLTRTVAGLGSSLLTLRPRWSVPGMATGGPDCASCVFFASATRPPFAPSRMRAHCAAVGFHAQSSRFFPQNLTSACPAGTSASGRRVGHVDEVLHVRGGARREGRARVRLHGVGAALDLRVREEQLGVAPVLR